MSQIQLLLLRKRSSAHQGFSMAEVLVAIMSATAFLLGSLQAMAINAVLQAKAERQAQASFWIQEDLETVKAAANDIKLNNLNCSALFYKDKYAALLRQNLYSNINGTTKEKLADGIPLYTDTSASPNNVNIQVAVSRKLVNRNYRLVRIINPDPKYPNVLKITYRVGEPYDQNIPAEKAQAAQETKQANALSDSENPTYNAKGYTIDQVDMLRDDQPGRTSILAEIYAEVIPNAVFYC